MTQTPPVVAPRLIYRLAAAFTSGAVVLGSAVCATESGLACPAWPGCYPGQLTPGGLHSAIEFTHRVVAFLSLVLLATASWNGRRLADRRLRWFPLGALVAALASGAFGMMIVLFSLPLALGVLDVAASQVALCLITWAAVRLEDPGVGEDRLGIQAWATLAVVVVMHLLGIVVAGSGSLVRCLGWPVWRIVASDESPALQWARIVLGVVAAAMLVWIMVRAWRRPALRRTVVALAIAFVVELAAGQFIVGQFTGEQARNLGFAALYSMLAGTIVWLIALLASRAGRPSVPSAPAAVPQAPARSAS